METIWVGIDWAQAAHAVCVLDASGEQRTQWTTPHTAAGLAALCRRLERYAPPAAIRVAIERPSGLLVDTLVAAGFVVVPIHPNALKAVRPRYRAAGSKSDPGDAYMLADLLRTDGHRLRALCPPSDATKALRALVRTRDDLVTTRVALTNQLRALLDSFWPGALGLFAELDSPIALAFLTAFPTPATRCGPKRLAAFLARQHYSGSRTPAELLARLAAAPLPCAGPSELAAKGAAAHALVAGLRTLGTELATLATAIEAAVATHADGPVVMSFPRAGRVNAAQILAELGDDRARFPTDEQLAAEAGVAPVTVASGKHRRVTARRACNRRLRQALVCFAHNSRRSSPWAADVYQRARARGCPHSHATRVLARAWVRILWRCWQAHTPYDPADHGAAQRLQSAA